MGELEVYRTLQELNKPVVEYDIDDQVTFDDLFEDLKDNTDFKYS